MDSVESMLTRKLPRNFDVVKLGAGYGVGKRLSPQRKLDTKIAQYRRGPLNGLIPGGAFGRAARSSLISEPFTYDRISKILRDALESELQQSNALFDAVENRNDGFDRRLAKAFNQQEIAPNVDGGAFDREQ